jgi:hypothetical protein
VPSLASRASVIRQLIITAYYIIDIHPSLITSQHRFTTCNNIHIRANVGSIQRSRLRRWHHILRPAGVLRHCDFLLPMEGLRRRHCIHLSVLSPIPSGPTADQAWGHIYAAEASIHKLQARLEKIKVKLGKDDPSLIYKTFRKIDKSRRQLLYPFQQGTLGKLRDAALETRNHLATALQVLDV